MTLWGTTSAGVPFGGHLLGRPAEGQRPGLGEAVGHQQVLAVAVLVGGGGEPDEVGRDQPGPLVEELVEGVLAVGARLAPEDLAGAALDRGPVPSHRLAVGLHGQLLQVGRKAGQALAVGQDGVGLGPEEVGVPDVQHPLEDRAGWPRRAPRRSDGRRCGIRPACRRTRPGRWPPSARTRWPSRRSSDRRPSPRSRTCWRGRSRSRRPRPRWWTRRRSDGPRPRRRSRVRRAARPGPPGRWSASPGW